MTLTPIINKLTDKIKKITYLIFVTSFALIANISTASFINLSSINTIDISTIDDTSDSAINLTTAKTPHQQILHTNIEQTKQTKQTNRTAFNQELQWRILNLLTQQLFDNNHERISDMLFSNSWLYATNTFAVSISSNDPDFYQVRIIDSRQGNETQLEVPRL